MQKDVFELPINTLRDLEACSFLKKPDCASCTQDGPGFGFACRDTIRIHAIDAIKALIDRIKELEQAQQAKAMSVEEAAKNAYSYYHTPDSVKPVFVQFRDKTYSDEGLTPPMARRCESKGIAQRTGQIRQGFCILDRPPIRRTDGRGGMGWNIRN